jgi:hypothetical protein
LRFGFFVELFLLLVVLFWLRLRKLCLIYDEECFSYYDYEFCISFFLSLLYSYCELGSYSSGIVMRLGLPRRPVLPLVRCGYLLR